MGWIVLLSLIVLLILSPIFSVESRDGRDWSQSSGQIDARRNELVGDRVHRGGLSVARGWWRGYRADRRSRRCGRLGFSIHYRVPIDTHGAGKRADWRVRFRR